MTYFYVFFGKRGPSQGDRCASAYYEMASHGEVENTKSWLKLLNDILPENIFKHEHSDDFSKQIGVVIISLWFHSVARITQRIPQFKNIPPVLTSVCVLLLGLNVVQALTEGEGEAEREEEREGGEGESSMNSMNLGDSEASRSQRQDERLLTERAKRGRESLIQKIVRYFDPSVSFLGNWMSLWLVPPLVLLPNAIKKVGRGVDGRGKGPSAAVWMRVAVVHFGLFVVTNIVSASIYRAIDGPSPQVEVASTVSVTAIASTSIAASEDSVSESEEEAAAAVVVAVAAVAEEKRQKQLKIMKFWGGVTIAFYAAAGVGKGAISTTPALACSSITALSAGVAMPSKIKKVLHPLLFTALVSGVCVILTEKAKRGLGYAGGDVEMGSTGSENDWTRLLFAFTPEAR